MKKLICILLSLTLLLCLCACKNKADPSQQSGSATTDTLPQIYDGEQYQIYQNLFFNDQKAAFMGQQMTVTGVFTSIYDSFNSVTRYYCWGYYDQTKCCDWQWELKLDDTANLPANGSQVTVTGTFAENEAALDKVWLTQVSISTDAAYTGPTCDLDLCLMNATLERVQLMNMQYFPADYEGKSVRLYGRVVDPSTIQHPYYDNAWTQSFSTDGEVPAIGTEVIVSGTFQENNIASAAVEVTTNY